MAFPLDFRAGETATIIAESDRGAGAVPRLRTGHQPSELVSARGPLSDSERLDAPVREAFAALRSLWSREVSAALHPDCIHRRPKKEGPTPRPPRPPAATRGLPTCSWGIEGGTASSADTVRQSRGDLRLLRTRPDTSHSAIRAPPTSRAATGDQPDSRTAVCVSRATLRPTAPSPSIGRSYYLSLGARLLFAQLPLLVGGQR